MPDDSGAALIPAATTTAPVTVSLGGRHQDEVWVRTSKNAEYVNVTAEGGVSIGTSATNTKNASTLDFRPARSLP
jgi:uncharacterized SAM-binding protein YcdF (DUF218 family)